MAQVKWFFSCQFEGYCACVHIQVTFFFFNLESIRNVEFVAFRFGEPRYKVRSKWFLFCGSEIILKLTRNIPKVFHYRVGMVHCACILLISIKHKFAC